MTEDEATPPDLSSLTDDQLLDAYEATSGTPGDPEADRLIAEIQRRGLDV
ncbi:hypothetical protein [Sphingomonas sp. DC2300-3]